MKDYNQNMCRILVVDDEPDIRELLDSYLSADGYDVVTAGDGVDAISAFDRGTYDLVILDIMIPKIDGFGVCEVIRKKSDVPVVFLSALDDEKSLMRGYDISADDYVTKPFSMPVFMRKVRAILKRKRSNDDADRITYDRVVMVPDKMLCTVDGKEIDLTSKEYELLLIMIKRPGYVYTRDMLLDMVWDYNVYVDERIVDSHIKNIRRKIGIDIIETVRGRGYRVASKD